MHSHRHAAKSSATDKMRRMTSTDGAPKGDSMGLSADAPEYHDGRFGSGATEDTSGKTGAQPKPRAFKRGGRVEGGEAKKRLDRPSRKKPADEAKGERSAFKSGGRVGKGKTTVNIVIAGQDKGGAQAVPVPVPAGGPPMAPPHPPMPPMPPQGAPMGMAMPPGGAPMPPGAPMPRKRGGRVAQMTNETGGAGGGEGRLAKAAMQKRAG